MPGWYYILRLRSSLLYVGATTDLSKRYEDHCSKKACRTTSLDPPIASVYSETFETFREARQREAQVKRWGNPRRIIDLWKNDQVVLCLSRDVLDEYVDVLQRIGLKDQNEIEELLSLFAKGFNILFTTKTPKLRAVEDDPDDDKFIECAVALKADVIITGDKALNTIGEYMGIRILTPQEFLKIYKIH